MGLYITASNFSDNNGWNAPSAILWVSSGPSLIKDVNFESHAQFMKPIIRAAETLNWHCPLGRWMPTTGNVPAVDFFGCPNLCPSGTVGDSPFLTAAAGPGGCTPCPVGHFCSSEGLAAGTPCPVGTRMPAAGYSLDSCFPCNPGQYNDVAGMVDCMPCPAGSFSEADSADACTRTAAGSRTVVFSRAL